MCDQTLSSLSFKTDPFFFLSMLASSPNFISSLPFPSHLLTSGFLNQPNGPFQGQRPFSGSICPRSHNLAAHNLAAHNLAAHNRAKREASHHIPRSPTLHGTASLGSGTPYAPACQPTERPRCLAHSSDRSTGAAAGILCALGFVLHATASGSAAFGSPPSCPRCPTLALFWWGESQLQTLFINLGFEIAHAPARGIGSLNLCQVPSIFHRFGFTMVYLDLFYL